jgi:hypothetical protein
VRLRRGIALAALGVAAAAAGCGEDPAETARQEVRETYERFVEASAAGNARTVCSLSAAEQQTRFIKDAEARLPQEIKRCEQAIAASQQIPLIVELNRDEADDPIETIEVAGDRARVVVSESGGFTRETDLVREAGGEPWKVAGED